MDFGIVGYSARFTQLPVPDDGGDDDGAQASRLGQMARY